MSPDILTDPQVRHVVHAAGFDEILHEFRAYLRCRGYAEGTVALYEQGAAHFAFWVAEKKLGPSQIINGHIATFLSPHLARCRCPFAGVRSHHTVRAALGHFAAILDAGRYRPAPKVTAPSDVDLEIQRLDDYLRATCGLREATRVYRRRYVREFLHHCFGNGPVDLCRLTSNGVVQFVLRQGARFAPGSAQVLASSLRSYFRFLRLRGLCDDALPLAVLAPANWRLASLPKVLTDPEVHRLLGVFNCGTATGRRDYAITRCLTDLGLRTGEVARLRLDDINWRKGTLRIVGGKSRRDDDLPLTTLLGRAITAYVHRGRPQTGERQIFVHVRPPVGRGMTRQAVTNVVRRAGARAGMPTSVTPRILRHTAATRMLCHGASIKEIADVLRHRCLDTTAIYTKVDRPRLEAVAAPWPQEDRP